MLPSPMVIYGCLWVQLSTQGSKTRSHALAARESRKVQAFLSLCWKVCLFNTPMMRNFPNIGKEFWCWTFSLLLPSISTNLHCKKAQLDLWYMRSGERVYPFATVVNDAMITKMEESPLCPSIQGPFTTCWQFMCNWSLMEYSLLV